jgi:hypothetical protein
MDAPVTVPISIRRCRPAAHRRTVVNDDPIGHARTDLASIEARSDVQELAAVAGLLNQEANRNAPRLVLEFHKQKIGGTVMFAGHQHTPLRHLRVGARLSANAGRGERRRAPVLTR